MIFVFSIGMIRKYMPKKEILLVILVAFLIGSIGGAFFLEPIYQELPSVMTAVERNMPNNEETLYLDLSSSNDLTELENNLSHTDGFKSYNEESVSISLWSFLADNYSASNALKSFSDWYKLVYGDTLSYAQVHSKLVIDASHLDEFEKNLLARGIVASKMEGPIQDSIDNANASMVSDTSFVLFTGAIGIFVAVLGIYFDSFVVYYRRLRKFLRTKQRR